MNWKKTSTIIILCLVLASIMSFAVTADDDHESDHEDHEEGSNNQNDNSHQESEQENSDDHESEQENSDDHESEQETEEEDEEEDEEEWDLSDDWDDDDFSSSTSETSNTGSETSTNNGQGTSNSGSSTTTNGITIEQIATHNTDADCWIIVSGGVYDITSLVNTHSGGNVFSCGSDNTGIYEGKHGTSTSRISSYYIGPIGTTTKTATQAATVQTTSAATTNAQETTTTSTIVQTTTTDGDKQVAILSNTISQLEQQINKLQLQILEMQAEQLLAGQENQNNESNKSTSQQLKLNEEAKAKLQKQLEQTMMLQQNMFQDVDNDGIIDSQDSDITKHTDKDRDGIDDAYDIHDDRPFFMKLLGVFGLVHA